MEPERDVEFIREAEVRFERGIVWVNAEEFCHDFTQCRNPTRLYLRPKPRDVRELYVSWKTLREDPGDAGEHQRRYQTAIPRRPFRQLLRVRGQDRELDPKLIHSLQPRANRFAAMEVHVDNGLIDLRLSTHRTHRCQDQSKFCRAVHLPFGRKAV